MYGNDVEKKHYGKTVREFNDDITKEVSIVFTDGTKLIAVPMGDCCAVTTILEVTGWYAAAGLYDFRLESIEQNNLGSITVGWETTDVFGTVVKFSSENYSSRDVLILCSCSHNGYYGGWVEWREEHVTVPGEVVS